MIIRTAKKQQRYSVVDNTGFEDARLSYKAKGLLGYFLTKPDNWEVRMADLLNRGTDGRDSIQKGLNELRSCGYAELQFVRGDNGKVAGKQWVIHENPIPPITGKPVRRRASTDEAVFPSSEKPTIGKSGDIVRTEVVVNTDVVDSTDYVRTSDEKKFDFEKPKKEKAPQIPAAPPRLRFSETDYAGGAAAFWAEIQQRFPAVDPQADFHHYHQRCLEWSDAKPATSNDWPRIAAKFILDDARRGDLRILQPVTKTTTRHDSKTNNSFPGGHPAGSTVLDTARIAGTTLRVAERRRRQNRQQ